MNQDEQRQRNRLERLQLWKVAAGGSVGLLSQAMAAWILDVSHQRVAYLCQDLVLDSRRLNGQLLICFGSVERYAKGSRRRGRPRSGLPCAN